MLAADEHQIDADLLRRYRKVRALAPQVANIALLRIGSQNSQLLIAEGERPQTIYRLAMGSHSIAKQYLLHAPPTYQELEGAIFAIEEQIAAAHIRVPAGVQLYSSDRAVRRVAQFSHAPDQQTTSLGIELVERSFNRLVNVTLGRPAAHEALPLDAEFVATLLQLRELLHHLRFSSLMVFA